MIEIIPNWHPLMVHFTVALWIMSFVFYLLGMFSSNETNKQQWYVVARWNLWVGFVITMLTVLAGWDAYNTVTHDTPSHEAMTAHRNWALVTVAFYLILTIWSYRNYRNLKADGKLFVGVMLLATVLLSTTAWRGGELVYRFGLGVMSMPNAGGHDHAGHANDATHGSEYAGHGHGDNMGMTDSDTNHGHDNSEAHGHSDSVENHHDQGDHQH